MSKDAIRAVLHPIMDKVVCVSILYCGEGFPSVKYSGYVPILDEVSIAMERYNDHNNLIKENI